VGDASRARIFEIGDRRRWRLVRELSHPESRFPGRELASDRSGRRTDLSLRSAMEPTTSPREVQTQRFAFELAALLKKGLAANAYARLVLVAPPHFLGYLREYVGVQVRKRIWKAVDKDLTSFGPQALTESIGVGLAAR
jgi:protein required for attachment to host cells